MTTLEELESIPRDYLKVAEVCNVLHTRPECFRGQAHWDKENQIDSFGFPMIVIGTRVKIPKLPFIKFMRGEN